MVSTSHPAATEAGLTALRKGGTAVDAYLAAAAVQTVVEPTMTSLGGGVALNVYDPTSGRSGIVAGVSSLPEAEDGNLDEDAYWSGRTVVPPAWVSSAEKAWQKWGKLAWADIFADALTCAREGFVVDQLLWGTMWEYRAVAGRLRAGRDVWCPGGRLVSVGDELRQPALARTLAQLSEQGPEYMYEGEFARNYVDSARAAGGRITLDDMARARSSALEFDVPAVPVAGGYELHTSGFMYALALSLVSVGELAPGPLPTEDGRALYLLMRIVEESWHHCLALDDGSGFSPESLLRVLDGVSPETAEKLWPQVESGAPRPFDAFGVNTNAIVVIDESGMIAHGTHSTSGAPFGAGLVADGVVVTRPITLFSRTKVPIPLGWGTSLLALRDGRPVFVAASPSMSAVQNVFQNSVNVLARGMTPGESVQQPLFGASHHPSQRPMVESSMGEAVLDDVERRGLGITPVTPWEPEMGSCHAVRIDVDGTLHGAADPRRLGRVAGL